MKHLALAASLLIGLPVAYAQSSGSCTKPVAIDANSGMALNIESVSSGIDIVGTDRMEIRISCTLPDSEDPERIALRIERTGDFGKIKVSGPRENNLHVRIEVPKKIGLRVRMAAGQVVVNDVAGDKDIELQAGQIIVDKVDSAQYHSVRASVEIGDVKAAAFGADKGGFFREINRDVAGGPYRIRAHVMTGSVELN